MSEPRKLTAKQARFVEEYLVDLNASAAARRAGYSAHRADAMGHENLGKPEIAAAISEAKSRRSERTKIDADWVLTRLAREADADMAALYDDAGNLRPIKDWPLVFRQGLVTGFETTHEVDGKGEDANASVVRKIKLQDRSKTIELIGKHVGVGAFKERLEIEDVTDRAEQMRQRREARLAAERAAAGKGPQTSGED